MQTSSISPRNVFTNQPLPLMKPLLNAWLFGLTAVATMSCQGPNPSPTPAKVSAKPAAGDAKPAVVVDPAAERDAYWGLAMKRYKPMDTKGSTSVADEVPESETPPTIGAAATPPPAVATTTVAPPVSTAPPATKPPALVPASIPFATRIPGKLGLVKSPYDPTGQSIDVRDFATGQMARCPYSGKIFRVPP